MALKGEAKKLYNKRRYLEAKASAWEKALWRERQMMRKALKRVATAERWKDAGEKVDERFLSLAFQWNAIVAEEKAKAKDSKRVLKRFPSARRAVRDAVAVSIAIKGPMPFPSVP